MPTIGLKRELIERLMSFATEQSKVELREESANERPEISSAQSSEGVAPKKIIPPTKSVSSIAASENLTQKSTEATEVPVIPPITSSFETIQTIDIPDEPPPLQTSD